MQEAEHHRKSSRATKSSTKLFTCPSEDFGSRVYLTTMFDDNGYPTMHPTRIIVSMYDDTRDDFTDHHFSFSASAHCRSFSIPRSHVHHGIDDQSSLMKRAAFASHAHLSKSFEHTDECEKKERNLLSDRMGYSSRRMSEQHGNFSLGHQIWLPAEDLFYKGVILLLDHEYLTDCGEQLESTLIHICSCEEEQLHENSGQYLALNMDTVMKGLQLDSEEPNTRDHRGMAVTSVSSSSTSSGSTSDEPNTRDRRGMAVTSVSSSSTSSGSTSATSSSPSSPPPSLSLQAAATLRRSSPISCWHKSLRLLSKPLYLLMWNYNGVGKLNTSSNITTQNDNSRSCGDGAGLFSKGTSFNVSFKGCKTSCMHVKSSIHPIKSVHNQTNSTFSNVGVKSLSKCNVGVNPAQPISRQRASAINRTKDGASAINRTKDGAPNAGKKLQISPRDQDHTLNGIKGAIAYCKQSQAN